MSSNIVLMIPGIIRMQVLIKGGLGTFIAWLALSWKIPARTHH